MDDRCRSGHRHDRRCGPGRRLGRRVVAIAHRREGIGHNHRVAAIVRNRREGTGRSRPVVAIVRSHREETGHSRPVAVIARSRREETSHRRVVATGLNRRTEAIARSHGPRLARIPSREITGTTATMAIERRILAR